MLAIAYVLLDHSHEQHSASLPLLPGSGLQEALALRLLSHVAMRVNDKVPARAAELCFRICSAVISRRSADFR